MLGSHLSISGGMVNALDEAERLQMECVQVFTKNQRRWSSPPLKDSDIAAWSSQLNALGWSDPSDFRTVSHNSYLINMASPDPDSRKKSLALQRDEIERCATLSIPLLVSHPGAHLGKSLGRGKPHSLGSTPSADEQGGLNRIIEALDQLHQETSGYQVVTCLETTTGSGSNLGYDFSHLAWIRDGVKEPDRVGFCLDTCHVTAAGYDMSSAEGAEAVLASFEALCGLNQLCVVHLNDSIGALGSRLDRHAHIGEGCCGDSCFEAILNHPKLLNRPMILETAKEEDQNGRNWDERNMERLRGFVRDRSE